MRAHLRLWDLRAHHRVCALLCALALAALPVLAQQGHEGHQGQEMPGEMSPEMAAMMEAWGKAMTPGEPHAMLADHAGSWKMTVKMWMEPGGEPQVSEATASREMIMGGRYLKESVQGSAMGQPFEGFGLTGYDNVTGKYWSSWVDNMSTGVMMSEGEMKDGKVVYHGTYNDAMTGEPTKTKTVWWKQGDDEEHIEMFSEQGGEWVQTMEIVSVRQ